MSDPWQGDVLLTFAEEIVLLLLDEETGELAWIDPDLLGMTLAGAVLMDLAFRYKVDADLDQLVVVDQTPTGEAVLDPILSEIATADQPRSAEYWVGVTARRRPDLERQVLARLIERGVLDTHDRKIFGMFGSPSYVLAEEQVASGVKQRLRRVIMSDEFPDPHDIVLVCLADACAIFRHVLSGREYRRAESRIEQIRKMDLIGQAVAKTIEALRVHLVSVISRVPM